MLGKFASRLAYISKWAFSAEAGWALIQLEIFAEFSAEISTEIEILKGDMYELLISWEMIPFCNTISALLCCQLNRGPA